MMIGYIDLWALRRAGKWYKVHLGDKIRLLGAVLSVCNPIVLMALFWCWFRIDGIKKEVEVWKIERGEL